MHVMFVGHVFNIVMFNFLEDANGSLPHIVGRISAYVAGWKRPPAINYNNGIDAFFGAERMKSSMAVKQFKCDASDGIKIVASGSAIC